MEEKLEIVQTGMVPPLVSTERGRGIHLDGTLKRDPRLLYTSNNNVVQRFLENVGNVRIMTDHGSKVRVAKFSPNGEWIASGDEGGKCFVWAHESFVIKNSIEVGKQVNDIAWDKEGKRICAVGSGKDDKGKVFPWNTNNKLGELSGAGKSFLCCDFKPNRPFRVVAGSEDYGIYYYKGPPFKFESYDKTHKNYVNGVRFTGDGAFYVTVSSDKNIHVYNGKTAKLERKITDKNGHKGTIYDISFSPDSTKFITCSADKTCKIWDFEKGEVIHTFVYADKPGTFDMQVGCIWLEKYLISISLSGKINFLDLNLKESKPVRVITGHRKTVLDMVVNRSNNDVYSSDTDSRIVVTECKSKEPSDMIGDPHKGTQIKMVRVSCDGNTLYSVATNDTLCITDITNGNRILGTETDKKILKLTEGAARIFITGKCNKDLFIIGTHKNRLLFYKNNELAFNEAISITPSAGDISADDKHIAIGCGENKNEIHIFDVDDRKEVCVIKSRFIRNEICCLAYSNDGKYLASADKNRHIWIWDNEEIKKGNTKDIEPLNSASTMQFHISVPSALEWSPDSQRLLSSALDGNIYLWLDARNGKNTYIHLDNAFVGLIRKISFIENDTLVGIGDDCSVRYFKIQDKQK